MKNYKFLGNIDKNVDYNMRKFNTTSKTKKHKNEVKDGLISRHRMDDIAYIQEQLNLQIISAKEWIINNFK